jgi:hypothetical protein
MRHKIKGLAALGRYLFQNANGTAVVCVYWFIAIKNNEQNG